MTTRLSKPIQGVARINPDCHESFDRSSLFATGYGKKRTKSTFQNMPFSAIFCHVRQTTPPLEPGNPTRRDTRKRIAIKVF